MMYLDTLYGLMTASRYIVLYIMCDMRYKSYNADVQGQIPLQQYKGLFLCLCVLGTLADISGNEDICTTLSNLMSSV